jgi:hypothetical protein
VEELAHPFTQCVSRKDSPSNLVTATCLNKEQNQWAYTLVRHGILWVPLWYILVSDVYRGSHRLDSSQSPPPFQRAPFVAACSSSSPHPLKLLWPPWSSMVGGDGGGGGRGVEVFSVLPPTTPPPLGYRRVG